MVYGGPWISLSLNMNFCNMRSLTILLLLLIAVSRGGFASQHEQSDTLSTILRDRSAAFARQRKLANLFYDRYLVSSAYDNERKKVADSLVKYSTPGGNELQLLAEILILRRNFNLKAAEKKLVEAIKIAQRNKEKYLLFEFYMNLAYVHTDQHDALAAIHNYRQAKKIAENLGDLPLLLSADVGISDLFTTIGLYQQALIYLNQAQQQVEDKKDSKKSSMATIYLNKADIFFNLGKLDSLRYYRKLTAKYGAGNYDLERNLKRLDYYALMLSQNHHLYIMLINFRAIS